MTYNDAIAKIWPNDAKLAGPCRLVQRFGPQIFMCKKDTSPVYCTYWPHRSACEADSLLVDSGWSAF